MHDHNNTANVSQESANTDSGDILCDKSNQFLPLKRSVSSEDNNVALKKLKPSVDHSSQILSRDQKESEMRMILKNVPYDVSTLSNEKYKKFRDNLKKLIDCVSRGEDYEVTTKSNPSAAIGHDIVILSDNQKRDSDSRPKSNDCTEKVESTPIKMIDLKLGNQPINGKPKGLLSKQSLQKKSAQKLPCSTIVVWDINERRMIENAHFLPVSLVNKFLQKASINFPNIKGLNQ